MVPKTLEIIADTNVTFKHKNLFTFTARYWTEHLKFLPILVNHKQFPAKQAFEFTRLTCDTKIFLIISYFVHR